MKRSCAHFHVVGLQQHASLAVPEIVQAEDELLERQHRGCGFYRLRFATADQARIAERATADERRQSEDAHKACSGRSPGRLSPSAACDELRQLREHAPVAVDRGVTPLWWRSGACVRSRSAPADLQVLRGGQRVAEPCDVETLTSRLASGSERRFIAEASSSRC